MPVAVRPDLSKENLQALLTEGHESETLDYKESCNINVKDELVELVKDIGAMQILGGYIVIGADDDGNPSGQIQEAHLRAYEQASFRAKLLKYLEEPFEVRCQTHLLGADYMVLVYVAPNPNGFAAFKIEGFHSQKKGVVFSKGAVYARHGTASEPWHATDIANVRLGIIARLKESWMREATEVFAAALPSAAASAVAAAPVGALNWELDGETFIETAIELIRRREFVPIKMLLTGVGNDLGALLADEDGEERVKTVLDRLACLAALALRLDEQELFRSVIEGFLSVYNLPVDRHGTPRLEQAMSRFSLWFEILQRVVALGAVAERLEQWEAIRNLVLQRGKGAEFDHYPNWYRHALTRAAQANLIPERTQTRPGGSLLTFAQQQIDRLTCLRFDVPTDDDDLLSSLCRFDYLACVVAIDDAGRASGSAFYPSFARFYESRTRPAAEDLIDNLEMRTALFRGSDAQLAGALRAIEEVASHEARLRAWSAYFGSNKIKEFVTKNSASETL
jgi:hypothetical protein